MAKKMTGEELVAFAKSKIGTPYIYGCKGETLTKEKYDYLQKTYGKNFVWDSDVNKVGKICVDCSGLISWACGMMRGSAQWFESATEKHPISEIKDAPVGALVWMKGHIGINIDGETYIAADGSAYGVRIAKYSQNKFTHWLLDENTFEYDTKKEDAEVIIEDKVRVNGKDHKIHMVRQDGMTYLNTRELCDILGFEVDNDGRVPMITIPDK